MGTIMKEMIMFRSSVSRGIAFTVAVLIIVLAAIAYGWVGSGQFTLKQVVQIYAGVLLTISAFGAGIWWVSRGEGFYE